MTPCVCVTEVNPFRRRNVDSDHRNNGCGGGGGGNNHVSTTKVKFRNFSDVYSKSASSSPAATAAERSFHKADFRINGTRVGCYRMSRRLCSLIIRYQCLKRVKECVLLKGVQTLVPNGPWKLFT